MRYFFLLFITTLSISLSSCKKEGIDTKTCLELETSASFSVDGTTFSITQPPQWVGFGLTKAITFRHDIEGGGGTYIVTIYFEGDSIGVYPLMENSSPNRALFTGPNSNNQSVSTGPGQTGTVTITDIESGCLSGSYAFNTDANTQLVQVAGEFQSLRPN